MQFRAAIAYSRASSAVSVLLLGSPQDVHTEIAAFLGHKEDWANLGTAGILVLEVDAPITLQ